MRKILLIIVCLAGMNTVNYAQYSKGKIALGGVIGMSYETTKSTITLKSSSFEILPSGEFFITNNFSVGLEVGYQSSMREYPTGLYVNVEKYTSSMLLFQPFVRRYFVLGEHLTFFGQAQAGVNFGKIKYSTDTYNQSEKSFEAHAGITPGLSFILSKRALIEATFGNIGFSTETQKPENGTKTTITGLTFHLNPAAFGLGVKFFLN
ncbi:MAG: hypothetical protein NTX61_04795 [Bacteroidetes bacterium]|nr:hypothetical protein [Bacteroidota bacterium]